jgi:5-methyltetrahydropteroyltriglutamate--homocysteine methyltransferase
VPAPAGSPDRVLTTHVGSLPRPARLAEWLLARELDEPFDRGELDAELAAAVTAVVERQVTIGIDVVSDGEMSKISYATYVKDRLTGFGGNSARLPALDLAPHAEFAKRMAAFAGEQKFKRMSCIGPVEYVGHADLAADLARLRAAADAAGAERCFMNAASPGLVSAFQPNAYYPSHAAYVEAVGAAMRVEYEAIVDAGFDLQLDCPDLAMARHTGFQSLTDDEFVARATHAVEVLNEATADIPPERLRMHVCWGNYEGPHDHDIALELVLPGVLAARPATILFEAANPRHEHEWAAWATAELPAGKVLAPGVIASTSNYVEHPELIAQRIERFAAIAGAGRVMASTDCGFGTFAGIGRVDPEIAYKKLASMVAGARLAAERLGAAA